MLLSFDNKNLSFLLSIGIILSFILESYDKYRDKLPNEKDGMFEILDNFIAYAKEIYKSMHQLF